MIQAPIFNAVVASILNETVLTLCIMYHHSVPSLQGVCKLKISRFGTTPAAGHWQVSSRHSCSVPWNSSSVVSKPWAWMLPCRSKSLKLRSTYELITWKSISTCCWLFKRLDTYELQAFYSLSMSEIVKSFDKWRVCVPIKHKACTLATGTWLYVRTINSF